MAEQAHPTTPMRHVAMLLSAAVMPIPWMVCHQIESHGLAAE